MDVHGFTIVPRLAKDQNPLDSANTPICKLASGLFLPKCDDQAPNVGSDDSESESLGFSRMNSISPTNALGSTSPRGNVRSPAVILGRSNVKSKDPRFNPKRNCNKDPWENTLLTRRRPGLDTMTLGKC
jgi:hypothetical protein